MIASLPMYDRPANAAAHDAFWKIVRDGLRAAEINAPASLDRRTPYRDSWARPDLVLGQICVHPLRLGEASGATLIGACDYGLEGCEPGYFRSYFVCRANDPRDLPSLSKGRFAANAKHSYSGFVAPSNSFAAHGLPLPEPHITGSHDSSVRAVATGRADFASIDARTWAMQQADLPETKALRVISTTASAPGQTLISRTCDDAALLLSILRHALTTLPADIRALLGLRDIVPLPDSAYRLAIDPRSAPNAPN